MSQQKLGFEAIGTQWFIEFEAPELPGGLEDKLMRLIDDFDATYSRFRVDSIVTAMSKTAGSYVLPKDAPSLLGFYEKMYRLTNGVVTPLIGKVLSDAGYDANYSLEPKPLTAPPAWEDVISVADRTITLRSPALLDFGAAGKGYLVDIVSELLESHDIKDYTVDAGGDMRTRVRQETVGLEHPDDAGKVIGVVSLRNASLCGSAGNRRAWKGLHHIMDPHSLKPVAKVKAVWTVAESTLVADGMATCLFFVEPEVLLDDFKFEYAIVYADNSYKTSDNLPGELFMVKK